MPTIVEALKQKYPNTTGSTIADVIKNSGEGGGGSGGLYPVELVIHGTPGAPDAWYSLGATAQDIMVALRNELVIAIFDYTMEEPEGSYRKIMQFSPIEIVMVEHDASTNETTYSFGAIVDNTQQTFTAESPTEFPATPHSNPSE